MTALSITCREARLAMSACSRVELALMLGLPAVEVERLLVLKLVFPKAGPLEDGEPEPVAYNEFPAAF